MNKKVVKGFIAASLLSVFCGIAVFGGCGGDGNDSPVNTPNEPDNYTEVGAYKVDAKLGDWSADDRKNHIFIPVADGQSAYIYAKKIAGEGVIIALDIKHHRYVDSSANKFGNSNFRFSFSSDGEERYFTLAGETNGITDHRVISSSDGEIRSTQMECFVKKELVENFDGEIRFGFRLHMSGYQDDYFWGYSGDWRTDGCDIKNCTYFITEDGITSAVPSDKTVSVDGKIDEFWQNTSEVRSDYNGYGVISLRGFKGDDGVYLLFSALHKECNTHQYWCYNPNFEFRLGRSLSDFKTFKAVRYNNDISLFSSTIGKGIMNTVYIEEMNMYETVCEMFIPYENIPGTDMGGAIVLGASFRADERDITPWVPVHYNGLSTWEMNSLKITENGLEALI